MLGAHNRIERIVYDENTKYLAMASLGNRISVLNIKRRNAKPFVVIRLAPFGHLISSFGSVIRNIPVTVVSLTSR